MTFLPGDPGGSVKVEMVRLALMDGSDFSPEHMCKTSEEGRPKSQVGNGIQCILSGI